MTKNNSFKKQIRSRMALTGETYAQAREALCVEHIPLKELLEAGLVLPSKDPKNRRLEDIFTPSELHDLKKSLVQRETVIVAGGAGTGKTAVLNTILNTYGVESRKPHGIESRIISIEENICELDVVEGDHFQLLARDTTSVEALLPNVMRMRPDAVAVGEIRINEMWMLHRKMEEIMAKLQNKNSTLIEEILSLMKENKENEISNQTNKILSIMITDWPKNYLMFEIMAKEEELKKYLSNLNNKEEENANQTNIKDLRESIGNLEHELQTLINNKKDLEEELHQLKENSEQEKVLLRKELNQ